METEEVRSKVITRNHAYMGDIGANDQSLALSPQNVISGFHESSQMNTIAQQSTDQKAAMAIIGRGSITSKDNISLLSPPSQKMEGEKASDRSKSANSQGSHVGRNKVFVPHLSFPEDINVDPREKRKIHVKPAGEAKYTLKKSSGLNITGAKKGYGKKAKLLEFNIGGGDLDNQLLEEPVAEDPMLAARG